MTSGNDEKIIFNQSWNKMKNSLYSEGYREGSSSGRDLTFQQGFDTGYSEGFQGGFALGLHNGILRCLKSEVSSLDKTIKEQLSAVEEVDKPSRGLCVICSQESVENQIGSTENKQETRQLTEIKLLQKKVMCDYKKAIVATESYSSVLNSTGLIELINSQ